MNQNLDSMLRRTLSLTTALAVLAVTGCTSDDKASATSDSTAAPQGRVLFQGQGKEHLEVALADLDGSDVTYPFSDLPGGHQTNPDWSPDGTQVVFIVAADDDTEDLWVAGSDGTGARMLLDCAGACRWIDDPAWSPDGASIVYSRTVERGPAGLGSLEEVDVATGEVSVIVKPKVRTFTAGARWSPDGSEIVFESVHKAGPGLDDEVDGVTLRVVEVASRRVGPPLTAPDLFAATADWSPDGTTIAYSGLAVPDAEQHDLFVIPASGGSPRRVTTLGDAGGYAAEPTWRADSTHLVFSGRLPGSFQADVLLTVAADGSSEPVQLGARTIIGRHPRVQPGH